MKKTEIKLGVKTNDIEDPILNECISFGWLWIKDNCKTFKSVKFELGEWTRDEYTHETNTKLMIELEE